MTSERTGHWTKMHRSLVRFSESEASNHTPSLADFTTTTPELKFSVHTAALADQARIQRNRSVISPESKVGGCRILIALVTSCDAPDAWLLRSARRRKTSTGSALRRGR